MPYDPERHGPRRIVGPGFNQRVYDVVRNVPAGFVTTYGDVAAALGLRSAARQVGYALAALPEEDDDVPWHRVVNARGALSARSDGDAPSLQAIRLESEGVGVTGSGRIDDFDAVRFVHPPMG